VSLGSNRYLIIEGRLRSERWDRGFFPTKAIPEARDIASGDHPSSKPTMKGEPRDISCHVPAERIFTALVEALGKPAPWPAQS
jgi:hypothetical protein